MSSLIELFWNMRSTSQLRINFVEEAKVLGYQYHQEKAISHTKSIESDCQLRCFSVLRLGIVISFFLEKFDIYLIPQASTTKTTAPAVSSMETTVSAASSKAQIRKLLNGVHFKQYIQVLLSVLSLMQYCIVLHIVLFSPRGTVQLRTRERKYTVHLQSSTITTNYNLPLSSMIHLSASSVDLTFL